jgi:hypothetical protein
VTDLLSYNAASGLAIYSVATGTPNLKCGLPSQAAGPNQQVIYPLVNAALGWTSITPLDLNGDALTDLLSYNSATGAAYYSIGIAPGVQQIVGLQKSGT